MSGTSGSSLVSLTLTSSLDTINVGTAGTFDSDANIDISSALNAALAQASPNNTGTASNNIPVDVVFNLGDYGVTGNILLQPDTTVSGLSALGAPAPAVPPC